MKRILQNDESIIYKFLMNLKGVFIIILMYIFRIFKIKNNRILIISYYGKEYGDNGKYVSKEILKRGNYDVYWALSNIKCNVPNSIKKVKYQSLKYYYILATSKIWINNCRFPFWIKKRRGQKYIQLWHGNIALKKIEFDVPDKLGSRYIKSAINDTNNIDYMFSNGSFCTNVLYRKAFQYGGKIIEYGTPRNDILINYDDEILTKVKKHFNLSKNDKILLYAPTFRKKYNNQYNIQFENVIDTLQKKNDSSWKVLLRLHPNVRNNANEYGLIFNDRIIDASLYDDMQELICSSDIIITDYSSVMFDGMIAAKPVVLYANDIEQYNDERGTYFELNELPFKISTNNEKLIQIFENYDCNDLISNYKKFSKKIGLIESGKSCEKVADIIEKNLSGDLE